MSNNESTNFLVKRIATRSYNCDKCRKVISPKAEYFTESLSPSVTFYAYCLECGLKSGLQIQGIVKDRTGSNRILTPENDSHQNSSNRQLDVTQNPVTRRLRLVKIGAANRLVDHLIDQEAIVLDVSAIVL